MNPILNLLIGPVLQAIEKYLPDPQAKANMQLELLKLQASEEYKQLDALVAMANSQNEVNKAEASSGNWFVASWRPLIGYVIGSALAYYYVLHPLLQWATGKDGPSLVLDDHLWELVLGMLGLGGMRTFEKVQGAAK